MEDQSYLTFVLLSRWSLLVYACLCNWNENEKSPGYGLSVFMLGPYIIELYLATADWLDIRCPSGSRCPCVCQQCLFSKKSAMLTRNRNYIHRNVLFEKQADNTTNTPCDFSRHASLVFLTWVILVCSNRQTDSFFF